MSAGPVVCSFCGAHHTAVQFMFEGLSLTGKAAICFDCVALAAVLASRRDEAAFAETLQNVKATLPPLGEAE
jgi:hypothetical protein